MVECQDSTVEPLLGLLAMGGADKTDKNMNLNRVQMVAGAAPTYALREGEDLQPALRCEAVEGVVALELAQRLELVRCGAQHVGVNTQPREQEGHRVQGVRGAHRGSGR